MTYRDIIESNVRRFSFDWPRYAFHMTGINNAINILSEGYIYSRNKAVELRKMNQDNASRGVIDNTDPRVKAFVRFYFRPKTPTYYHFEGYHQEGLRFQNEDHVNMAIPVLLLFDLETLLCDERTRFNGIKASGSNYNPQRGVEAFSSLQFNKIYHDGVIKDKSIRDYRHAEVLYPEKYPIEKSIKRIICRNDIEAATLKRLLKQANIIASERWEPLIESNSDYFDLSGLMVISTKVYNHEDTLVMKFKLVGHNKYYSYIQNPKVLDFTNLSDYPPLDFVFDVQFQGNSYHHTFTAHINLNKKDEFSGTDNIPYNAKKILLKGYFNEETNIAFSVGRDITMAIKKFKLVLDCNDTMKAFPTQRNNKDNDDFVGFDEPPF